VSWTAHIIVARLLAMSLAEQMPLVDAKNHLSEVVDRLQREHGRVVITRHGRPAAVMLSLEDLESLEETLEVLSSPTLLAEIREAVADRDAARALSYDEATRLATGR
jgi:prevent-host-death family protein